MGLMNVLNIGAAGQAVTSVAEVFTRNATRRMELDEEAYARAMAEFGGEFVAPTTAFDSFVNGLNRLPRPCLALGTIALFVYAMAEPDGFSRRMAGLQLVPEPLWWLLAAVVGFYFGAREAHYFRQRQALKTTAATATLSEDTPTRPAFDDNAALADWANGR